MYWNISHDSLKGTKKPENQDRVVVDELTPGITLAAVFDGHGRTNEMVEYCARNIPMHLLGVTEENAVTYLYHAFFAIESYSATYTSGSTASVTLLFDSGRVFVAVLGDSPVVVKTNGKIWTAPEHNVFSNETERKLAIKRGGIYKDGYIFNREGAQHQVSRSFGDSYMAGIISKKPEIFSHRVEPGEWVAVMSDGVLDSTFASYQVDKEILVKRIELGANAKDLTNIIYATKHDDASAIVCRYLPPEYVRTPEPKKLEKALELEFPKSEPQEA
jgi:serine/threonine protein phosphatase PrpC